LLESELFGHERSAFTGAVQARPDILEQGSGGTVFLDEVGELPLASQAKLLRALETRQVQRVGAVQTREVDIRLVAATNRNLEAEVSQGRFRQDLFYRHSAGLVWIPPLRDRPREIAILARLFLTEACEREHRDPPVISDASFRLLASYAWPGNVRELRNLMEFAAATVTDPILEPSHLLARLKAVPEAVGGDSAVPEFVTREDQITGVFPVPAEPPPRRKPIDEEIRELERMRMAEALAATGGNQTKAAELISMPLRTFQAKVKQYGLSGTSKRGRPPSSEGL